MGLIPANIKSPPKYLLGCILCSANGLLFGMDTGTIGPVTDMEYFKASFGGSENSTIHGLIVSCILIPAALSSFFAGYVADRLGRPKGICIGVFIFGLGAAIEAGAVALSMFIVGRIVEGLGEGLFLGNLVVLICEISPTRARGALTTGPQLATTLGLVLGYFVSYGTSGIQSSLSWRLPWIILASLSMVLCALSFFFLPESPQWLGLHGKYEMAEEAWERLGVTPAEREKVEVNVVIRETGPDVDDVKDNTTKKLLDIFSKDVWGRTVLAVFLMGMQQMSGIDGVLYVCRTHSSTYPAQSIFANRNLTVCASTFPKSRTCFIRSEFSSIRCIGNSHLCSHCPRAHLCRRMGPPKQHYIRWCRNGNSDVFNGWPVCRKCSAPINWRWSLGRDCLHLSFCSALFR
jgi:MFS family permease